MKLWVEVAIPTAMILSHDTITFEKDTQWEGTTYWDNENATEMEERFQNLNYDFNELNKSYKKKELYIHPVKLSKWQL